MTARGVICTLAAVLVAAGGPMAAGPDMEGLVQIELAEPPGEHAAFGVRRARLKLRDSLKNDVEFGVQLGVESGKAELKDAFVQVPIGCGLSVEAGQMKRPFSREYQVAWRSLPFARRGIVNDLFRDDVHAYAGRDRGVLTSYTLRKGPRRLEIAAGVFNGTGTEDEDDEGKQLVARVDLRLAKGWEVGGGWTWQPAGAAPLGRAWGIDGRLERGDWEVTGELLLGLDRDEAAGVRMIGSTGSVLLELGSWEPGLRVERVDPNRDLLGDAAWAWTPHLALRIAKSVRLFAEITVLSPTTGPRESELLIAWRAAS